MAPTLLQSLLRQPTKSYSNYSPSISSSSSSYDYDSSSQDPSRRRTTSLRSSSSRDSRASGDWSNGQWDWAHYGGRKGLTGGPSSIHPSEVASALGVQHERSASRASSRRSATTSEQGFDGDTRSEDGDRRSLKSSRSLGSVRSLGSKSGSKSMGNGASWTAHGGQQVLPSGPPPKNGTSRRYSNLPTSSSFSSSTSPSRRYSSLEPRSSSSSTTSSTHRAESTPSLASSVSSAPSSPPITPIQSIADITSPPDPVLRKKKSKRRIERELRAAAEFDEEGRRRTSSERGLERVEEGIEVVEDEAAARRRNSREEERPTIMEESTIEHGSFVAATGSTPVKALDQFAGGPPVLLETPPTPVQDSQAPDVAPSPIIGHVYTPDEFFALASGTSTASSTPSPPPPRADPSSLPPLTIPTAVQVTVESDSDSSSDTENEDDSNPVKETVIDPVPAPAVFPPRISLTRTESDQEKSGAPGDIDLHSDSPGPSPSASSAPSTAESPSRKRSTKRRSTTPIPPATTIEVIKSASPSKRRSTSSSPTSPSSPTALTTANLSSSTKSSSAASDTPEWLSRIRALGDPIQPLVQPSAPVVQTPQRTPEHWSVKQGRAREARRASSAGNLRAPSVGSRGMGVVPEVAEEEEEDANVAEKERRATMSSSPESQRRSQSLGDDVFSSTGSITRSTSLRSNSASAARPLSYSPSPSNRALSPSPSRALSPSPADRPYSPTPEVRPFSPAPSSTSTSQPFSFLDSDPSSSSSVRPRAISSFSDSGHSIAGEPTPSISGMSTKSAPTGNFTRPPKSPKRNAASSAGGAATMTGSGGMRSLSVSAAATLSAPSSSSRRFSFFKSPAPPLSSTITSSTTFSPMRDLSFGTLVAAPSSSSLRTDDVLVDIFAVGLDRKDLERTKQVVQRNDGFGWVPGRAFVGRAKDVGKEGGRVRRGEIVWGVASVKKSGALGESMIVHRDNVAVAPAGVDATQLAALAAPGTIAYQIMESLCGSLPKGSKILILNAHTGIGALCLQLGAHLASRDLYLVAHCPSTSMQDEHARICRKRGASRVMVDEPLATLNALHESEFDVVIDTIGGRRLYDASRRVIHHSGSFITVVGDSLTSSGSSPGATGSSSSSFSTSIRSLRRTFFKKDKKALSYWFVDIESDERESMREVLDKLKVVVEKGGVDVANEGLKVVELEKAKEVFKEVELDSQNVVVLVKDI